LLYPVMLSKIQSPLKMHAKLANPAQTAKFKIAN